ncbi:MAG TPA: hypothetical protein VMW74_08855 [Nitrosopumilaceae archaeon]|nr:hypothetical protein [Nitrosopumilaceae archaeon]
MSARSLAEKQFKYLLKQIKQAEIEINGLVPEFDEEQQYDEFINSCVRQKDDFARIFGFRL